MTSYIVRRLLLAVPVLFGVILIVFLMVRLIPGDPALVMAGEQASEEQVEQIRRQFHLDEPIIVQFGLFLSDLARGDLGRSTSTGWPVAKEIAARFPNTLRLTLAAMALASVAGVMAGVISATRPYSVSDNLFTLLALVGMSMPVFWLGLMLMLAFSVKVNIFPAAGAGGLRHLVLPAVTLGAASTAIICRMTRSSMLEVIKQDYVRTARAKGLAEKVVIYRHALKNALIPVVTVVGLQMGTLLGGAVLTETVFAWPGLGRLMVNAILARDYPVVQGVVLVVAMSFIVINLIVDLMYAYLDPRIRY